jgi:hypothetical protein
MAILCISELSFGERLRRLRFRQLLLNPINNPVEHFLETLTCLK